MLETLRFCKIKPRTKQPAARAWQKSPLTWEEVRRCEAVGVLCGRGGFLAIDCDGQAAIDRLAELFGGQIPDTWAWTSGKPGRIQFGFLVPEQLRDRLLKARYWEDLPDGSQLDFRWKGCQSVLPPSPHPETGAYLWVRSPNDCELTTAPEWLIEYAIALKNRKLESIRLPARLYSTYKAPLKAWCLAQLAAKGSGRAEFSLEWAAGEMQRSISSVRRLLKQARSLGLIRHFHTEGDRAWAYPYSLKKIAKKAGLESLAEIAEIKYEDIKNLNIKCTEAVAAGLQRASLHAAREAQKELPPEQQIKPVNPFSRAELGKRVLWKGDRFLGVSEGFVIWGASQKAIAVARGISERSIQRHLSATYRRLPSKIRGSRAGLVPVVKAQLCQRLPRHFKALGSLQNSRHWPEGGGKILICGDRAYRCYANLYQFESAHLSLATYKFRRAAYSAFIAAA